MKNTYTDVGIFWRRRLFCPTIHMIAQISVAIVYINTPNINYYHMRHSSKFDTKINIFITYVDY